jgi:hypothetical protein
MRRLGGRLQACPPSRIRPPDTQQSPRNHGRTPVLKPQVVPRSTTHNPHRVTALATALLLACLIAATLSLWPGDAGGAARQVTVLGQSQTTPPPACPKSPCEAVGSVSGFQTRAGSVSDPMVAPYNGKIVAWSISLSNPKASQQSFFNNFYGTPPEARIGVVRAVPNKTPPRYQLLSQAPTVNLTSFLGSDVTFALDTPLSIKKGDIVALTIPTWAPAFAVGLTDSSGWRASRKAGKCTRTADIKESHPQQKIDSNKQYGCFYKTARLLYTATVVKG